MAAPRLVEERSATGPVKAIFEEIKRTLQVPFVPTVFRALATDPAALASMWTALQQAMTRGTLDVRSKAMVAFAVAVTARSPYLRSAQAAALKRFGLTDAELEELRRVITVTDELARYAEGLHLTPDLET